MISAQADWQFLSFACEGIIANGHAVVNVSDTLFHNNVVEASGPGGRAGGGGMSLLGSASATLVKSVFTANRCWRAEYTGGAGLGTQKQKTQCVFTCILDS